MVYVVAAIESEQYPMQPVTCSTYARFMVVSACVATSLNEFHIVCVKHSCVILWVSTGPEFDMCSLAVCKK